MAKDVKIEILYFKTPSDISLEFGLHGDYPLRLLTSFSNDLPSFFKNLKRAVSRSEIILVVGGYSEDNLPRFLAHAIGQHCIIPNYRKHGILTETKYIIPEKAIPLATKDHRFGGFLIEQGPQTIISLADDRVARLAIINEIVVNYITEHYNVFNKPFFADIEKPGSTSEIPAEFHDISSLAEDSTDNIEPGQALNTKPSDTESNTQDNINIITQNGDNTPFNVMPVSIDELLVDDNDDDEFLNGSKRKRRAVRIICIILSIIVLLTTALFAFFIKGNRAASAESSDYYLHLSSLYTSESNPCEAFLKIKSENPSYFSWLSSEALGIFHPVFYTDSAETNYLYSALPDKTPHSAGSLFSNTNPTDLSLGKIVIHGNAATNGILAGLAKIDNVPEDIIDSAIYLANDRYICRWNIFSVFTYDGLYNNSLIKTDFENLDDYEKHLNTLTNISIIKSKESINNHTPIITLVGRIDDKSYVIVANLSAVNILSYIPSDDTLNNSNPSNTTSSEEDPFHNDFVEEQFPDIVLPPLQQENTSSVPSAESSSQQSSTSSDSPSQVTSQNTSTEISSTEQTSSHNTSTEASSTEQTSSQNSSTQSVDNSTISSSSAESSSTQSQSTSLPSSSVVPSSMVSSSHSSSQTTSSTPPKPQINPIYTWDVELSVKWTKNGVTYTGNAVEIVAMIIEQEMSPTIDPPEAVIAQAIVKYNWLINNGGLSPTTAPSNAMDPNPTDHALKYAQMAKGSVLMYGNTVARTYCHAYSAGYTANYSHIWGGTAPPYIQSVPSLHDEKLKDFETVKTYTAADIRERIKNVYDTDTSSIKNKDLIKAVAYDNNGLYCVTVSIGGKEYRGTQLRDKLLAYDIRSSAYTIVYDETTESFTITCKGYGHGVGLSQRGAKAFAKEDGWNHEQILMHYFPGTTLVKN